MQKTLLIYNFLYLVALIFILPLEYFKRPTFLRKRWIREKFGFFEETESNLPTIWVHAVSVGEVSAVSKMIMELSNKYRIVLSTITDTGQRIAQERFKNYNVKVVYMPFDISWAIKRFLKSFNPIAIIITETELWPNLISIGSKNKPVIVVNGRISEKSFRGYSKIKFFIKPLIKKLSLICVQEQNYKERFIAIGADKKKIHVTGNMKFDIELKDIKFIWEDYIPSPVIIAGSTHEPEEDIILDAFLKMNIKATLVIAPRHPERFSEVETLIREKIANINEEVFFSKLTDFFSKLTHQNRKFILLIDQMGILGSLYRLCDFAIIGGSFIPHGGQNPLEPSFWKKPFVCGPYMHNFPFTEEFIREKACLSVDRKSLLEAMRKLAENHELRKSMGERAYQIFLKNSGATKKTLNLLEKFIL
ncbi:MAG: 3-deoxy-D-manno-octulosonic acid transferase [Thermodesulfovibrio sp.]|nr:3-deoxy-D-manno-octulosonic acid transferase [Thermodesulfovibrio sp.]MDW7998024.1 3-deoxy-D-manno-octulosonic acid transferase [Thermodesulfovibrio sp.]